MTKERIPFTVLLISFNNFRFIFEALDSIFRQTYNNIQLIISDDASEDFDREELQKYIDSHPHKGVKDILINVNEQNLGTVKHLEKLHKMTTGELVTVIAADDAYACDDAIESLVDEYEKYEGKVPIITSLLAMCDSTLKKQKSIFTSEEDVQLINSGDRKKLLGELARRCIMPSSGTAVKRELYEEGERLSDRYVYVEDWSSHIIWVREGKDIRCIRKVTVLHRDGGISHGNKRVNKQAFLQYYKDLLTIYEYEVRPYDELLSEEASKKAEQAYQGRRYRYEVEKQDFESEGKEKIVFFFRKNLLAKGDYSMYYRMADYIADKYPDRAVYCVNNANADLMEKYKDGKIFFCSINKYTKKLFEGATFVTAYNQLFFLLDEMHGIKGAKILLLFLHPQMADWMNNQVNLKKYDVKDVARMLKENQAYAFMDDANKMAFERKTGVSFEDRYFPVTLDKEEEKLSAIYFPYTSKEEINIVWLGRLDTDKIHSVINFLDNIYELSDGKTINLHLIGDGNGMKILLSKLPKYHPIVRIFFNSYLYGEKRDKYIRENADLVVAMGISALDASILGVPTIITPVCGRPFRSDKFVYLFDTVNYCLGWELTDLFEATCTTHTAEEVFADIFENGKKEEYGKKCREFALREFAVEKHAENLLRMIDGTALTEEKALNCSSIKRQFIRYRIVKKFCGLADYWTYLSFKSKWKKLSSMPFHAKVKKLLRGGVKILKRGVKKIVRILRGKR